MRKLIFLKLYQFRGRIFSQAGNELEACSFPARNKLSMLFPSTSFPAKNELILKLTKNMASEAIFLVVCDPSKNEPRATKSNYVNKHLKVKNWVFLIVSHPQKRGCCEQALKDRPQLKVCSQLKISTNRWFTQRNALGTTWNEGHAGQKLDG
jgi:hypothetical protein